MPIARDIRLTISNYKCFAEPAQGFEIILPMNLIIGRNNSGKSALLDLIQYAVEPFDLTELAHRGRQPQVEIQRPLTADAIRRVFPDNTSGGGIPGSSHWEFAQPWITRPITYTIPLDTQARFIRVDPVFPNVVTPELKDALARAMGNPFANMRVRRLAAARQIAPELGSDEMSIKADGGGATTVLQNFINKTDLPSAQVEEKLLAELNAILEPDGRILRITTQQDRRNSKWEVYLEEAEKGRVSLSHSGSGIQTIILVLSLLYLVPLIEKTVLGKYVFAFEELENNLHPALQRRLLAYLKRFALETGATFFLTTHSNVAIDIFASDADSQVVHVTHDHTCALARRATTYVAIRGMCDDLDVRASDLLQANGVVWVEGPSDRLYFNRWIDLWSNGELKEGLHYQCIFYGGRLLSHLSATSPEINVESVVKILRVNRNALVLIDSDKQAPGDDLNATKRRLVGEIEDFGGLAWVTAGREIENYLPPRVLAARFDAEHPEPLGQFETFADYIDRLSPGARKSFLRSKSLFAESVIQLIKREDLADHLDLATRLEAACKVIRGWNGAPSPGSA